MFVSFLHYQWRRFQDSAVNLSTLRPLCELSQLPPGEAAGTVRCNPPLMQPASLSFSPFSRWNNERVQSSQFWTSLSAHIRQSGRRGACLSTGWLVGKLQQVWRTRVLGPGALRLKKAIIKASGLLARRIREFAVKSPAVYTADPIYNALVVELVAIVLYFVG